MTIEQDVANLTAQVTSLISEVSGLSDQTIALLNAIGIKKVTLDDAVAKALSYANDAKDAANTVNATSTTSLTVGAGAKSLVVQTEKQFSIGQWITVAYTNDPSYFMYGQVTAYDKLTGALDVNVTYMQNSGTFDAWTVALSSVQAPAISQIEVGTAATPTLNFRVSPTSGLYSPGNGEVGIAVAGVSRITATATGATVNGTVAATAFSGPLNGNVTGNVTGDLTGNVTGNLTGNVTGNVTGDVTGNVSGTASNVTGVVAVDHGGTGISAYTSGDMLYANGAASMAKLASAAMGNVLTSGGVGSAPAWGKVGLTTHVAGTLGVDNGGTGATTLTGYVKGNGTAAMSANPTIPNTDITGLGTMSTQDANAVNITGGAVSAATGAFASLSSSGDATMNNLTVTGNFVYSGNSYRVDSNVVTVDDPIMTLGGSVAPTVDDGKDRGVEFRWHDGVSAKVGFFGFDRSTGNMTFIPDGVNTAEVFTGAVGTLEVNLKGNVTGNVTGDVAGNAASATKLQTARTINGTAFDGTANIAFDTDSVAEGAARKYYTDARARAAISVTGPGGTYDSNTGIITISGAVKSVAGRGGDVVLANTDISGLGTMSVQNADTVAVTGGTINGTVIGGTAAAAGTFTALGAKSLAVTDTSANGSTVKMTGDGVATPSKTLRVKGGNFEVLNDAGSAAVLSLTDGGNLSANRLISTVANGTAPLAVTSATVVTNLNADLLDGQEGTYYRNADNLNAGTVPAARLPIATATAVGAVKAGDNITIDAQGRISGVNSYVLPPATATTLGGVIAGSGFTIDNTGKIDNVMGAGTLTYFELTATDQQTNFTIPGGFNPNLIRVSVDGFTLPPSAYDAQDGQTVKLKTPCYTGQNVLVEVIYSQSLSSGSQVKRYPFVATDAQKVFNVKYPAGSELLVRVRGSIVGTDEYTATDGATVTFNTGLPAGTTGEFIVIGAMNLLNAVAKTGDTMTGALVVPAGTAVAPSVNLTGALTSGLYSPGANQVGLAANGKSALTGDANGVVRFPQKPIFCGALADAANVSYVVAGIVQTFTLGGIVLNANRLTLPTAGKYRVTTHQLTALTAGTTAYLQIRKNGNVIKHGYNGGGTASPFDLHVNVIDDFAAGDYIDFFYQGTFNTVWGGAHSTVTVEFLG